jgi:hypothetical protein
VCVIVDANLASQALRELPEPEFVPLLNWLQTGGGILVVGGRLTEELDRLEKPRHFVLDLLRAGRARSIPKVRVEEAEEVIEDSGHCRSNDRHVVALARVSGARTLCTHDKDLQKDFRNPRLISAPRGSIYKRAEHAPLLRHTTSCGKLVKRNRR